jgi:hypothetical protein
VRVFLYAPREAKARRLRSEGMSDKEAEELVDTVDRDRAAFIDRYFHMEWPNRPVYHAMLNTIVGDEIVIQTIMQLKRHLEQETR